MKINCVGPPCNLQSKTAVNFKNSEKKGGNGWFVIPSCVKNYDGFIDTTLKLSKLWTDDNDRVRGLGKYLGGMEYHVYLEDGKAKLGVRFKDDKTVDYVYGEDDAIVIPEKYLGILEDYIKGYDLSFFASFKIDKSKCPFVWGVF